MILSRCSSKFPLLETTLLHHTHYLRHHRKPRWLETNTVTRYKSIRYIEVVQVIPINRGDVKKRKKKEREKRYPCGTGTARTRIPPGGFMTRGSLEPRGKGWSPSGESRFVRWPQRRKKKISIAKPASPKRCQRSHDPSLIYGEPLFLSLYRLTLKFRVTIVHEAQFSRFEKKVDRMKGDREICSFFFRKRIVKSRICSLMEVHCFEVIC